MSSIKVNCGNIEISNDNKICIIAGPCQLETEQHAMDMAGQIKEITKKFDLGFIYKTSFDKANRTSLKGQRGAGLEASLPVFDKIKKELGVPILTDIHNAEQCSLVADHVDVLQIPAFLCRQTDLLVECAKYFNTINIKKGQWLSADAMKHAVTKIKEVNPNCEVWLTERGSNFGYDRLIVDFRGVDVMKEFADKVIFDCTHSTQMAGEGITGGSRKLAKQYSQVAHIFEYDGIFVETHPDPKNAISDSGSQVELDWIVNNIDKLNN